MSEEQKNKHDRKTADRDFLRALSPEQLAAIDGLRLAPEAIPGEIRPDILAMTPEQVASHLNIGLTLTKSRQVSGRKRKLQQALILVTLAVLAWFCQVMAVGPWSGISSYLSTCTYTIEIVFLVLLIDMFFVQFNLYELLKVPKYAMVFVVCLFGSAWFGSLSGGGSVTINAGQVDNPAEPKQEQRAEPTTGLSQREADIISGANPPYREGNAPTNRYSNSSKED